MPLAASFQATVTYYLLLDNRFRVSSGYLESEFQETTVCVFLSSSVDSFPTYNANQTRVPPLCFVLTFSPFLTHVGQWFQSNSFPFLFHDETLHMRSETSKFKTI